MTKKNKYKRKILDSIIPNIFNGGGPINLSNMYTLGMNLSGPQLPQSGLPSSYLTMTKYSSNPVSTTSGSLGSTLVNTMIGAGMGAMGTIGGNLISGGKSSGVGNTIGSLGSTVGGAAMLANPLVGGAIMLGSNILGGGINALFGSDLNEERISLALGEINKAKGFNINASNFDDLSSLIANAPVIANFSLSDIGSDGLFSDKAKNTYRDLLAQKQQAEKWVKNSITNATTNLQLNQMNNLLTNYAAYGGLLDNSFGGGAIDYDLANQQLGINAMKAMGLNRQYSLPNMGLNTFAKGGKIHIKPENRGKFTALKKRTGKSATWFKEHGTPALRKMATFELNARKWKHAFGGDLLTNGGVFSNGVTTIGNGGTHEESPYEGVLMGIDPLGIPNLVEEGETVWNDYVFSNRIPVPNAVRNKYKLRGTKGMSFSDAAKKILKISEERPNDPISMETMDINLSRLALEQEAIRELKNMNNKNTFKKGGPKKSKIPAFTLTIGKDDFIDPRLDKAQLALGNPLGLTKDDFAEVGMVDKDPYANITFNKKNNDTPLTSRWFDETLLRYAPVVGSAIGLGLTLLSSPDYSRADALALYAQNAGKVTPISYDPLGNYLTYRPNDVEYIANKMAALAAATRRGIMNTSGGNRANAIGSLLAADYNALIALADAIRQGEDTNWNRYILTETYNRGTDLYNSEAALKAAMANQEARLKASQLGLSGYTTAMLMKDAIDALRNASINANLTNLFDSLGNIGIDAYNRKDRDMLLRAGVFGTLSEKPQGWSEKRWTDYKKSLNGTGYRNGGKLKKKRGGFTY